MALPVQRLSFLARVSIHRVQHRARRKFVQDVGRPFSVSTSPRNDESGTPHEVSQKARREILDALKTMDSKTLDPGDLEGPDGESPIPFEDLHRLDLHEERFVERHDSLRHDYFSDAPEDEESMGVDDTPRDGLFVDEDEPDAGPDPEFIPDDISATGHAELEQLREMRQFSRVIVWDMPLLYNHIKLFEPPTSAQPLRFRYTSYLGENHPASRKVVMQFSPEALPDLTEIQTNKLIKLLGARYNPSTKEVRMSCEMFPTLPQNKRYLGELLDKLLAEARDPNDTFEDVPFDFRHHKPKPKYFFPEEWKLTQERKEYLEAIRSTRAQLKEPEPVINETSWDAQSDEGVLAELGRMSKLEQSKLNTKPRSRESTAW